MSFRAVAIVLLWAPASWLEAADDRNALLNRAVEVAEAKLRTCGPELHARFGVEAGRQDAADFLIHEYLHTRGLSEWPHGGKCDSVAITRIVKESCSAR